MTMLWYFLTFIAGATCGVFAFALIVMGGDNTTRTDKYQNDGR
mgnify:CR=1 FL=1